MARLIVKSPYYKCGGNTSLSGYLRYIATRERVELLPDDRPPTRKQKQLTNKLTKDFPDSKTLYEYEDYAAKPTKFNASAFITMALESNWDKLSTMEGYAGYIAARPRAVRLGYDRAKAWRDLLRTHRNDIAAAMNIPPNDFRWYAAFHDEGDHPHVHMMAWSAKPGQAYLSRDGIRQIKSELTNDIFKQELLHLYEQKSASRDELVHEARKAMLELVQVMKEGICDRPEAERLMLELAMQLETVKGKKSYGYLPKPQKKLVDKIADEMERLPSVRDCYDQRLILQEKVDGYYHDKPRERKRLSQEKAFRHIKNAVIKEAENIRQCNLFFEDKGVEQESEPEEFRNASYDYENLRDGIRDESLTLEEHGDAVDEMNELAKSGDKYAQYLMGKLWRDGPLLTPDWVNARYWFQKSAEQGHPYAQYALGKLLLSDDVEVHDVEDGIKV